MVRVGNNSNGCELVSGLEICDLALAEVVRFLAVEILDAELFHDLIRRNLTLLLCDLLDHIRELLVHAAWKLESKEAVHNESNTALSGLAVDTDHRLVLSSDIGRIDRQIRNLPDLALSFHKRMHSLVDSILMGTGECSKYQLSSVRMTRIDMHLCAALVNLRDLLDVADLKLRIDSLREHIVGDGQDIHVSGTLTISEQGSLNAVSACKHCKFCSSDTCSAVIMRMNT